MKNIETILNLLACPTILNVTWIFLTPYKHLDHVVLTFSQRVQCVDHQLEDGAPQRGVVEGRRAAASLQDGTHLQANTHKVRDQTTAITIES